MEILPEEQVQLDEVYALLRKALNAGIPIDAIREELESAIRTHISIARRTIADWEHQREVK
jgi:hypothetical protein